MDPDKLKKYIEAALLAAGQPMTLAQLNGLFEEDEQPGHSLIRQALAALDAELEDRAVELVEVAGGFRLQIRQKLMPVISRMWTEKPPRYSRALLETLAIIAYRQPITRGEIEQIRGVSLSANILKTLQDREWIKTVGHRDVPGKPELLGTTKEFLDYFNLKGLDDLPTLAEIRDLENLEPELNLADPDRPNAEASQQDAAEADAEDGPSSEQEASDPDPSSQAPSNQETTNHEQAPETEPESTDAQEDHEEDESDAEHEDELDDELEEVVGEDDEEDDGPEPQAPEFEDDSDDEPDESVDDARALEDDEEEADDERRQD
jgi:segregation and condensation protein B